MKPTVTGWSKRSSAFDVSGIRLDERPLRSATRAARSVIREPLVARLQHERLLVQKGRLMSENLSDTENDERPETDGHNEH